MEAMSLIKPDGNAFELRSGDKPTTQIGYVNANRQICQVTFGVYGTDHNQYAYRLECLQCGYVYGANGSDIAARLCPKCQRGVDGIQYGLPDISPKAFKLTDQ
jgi:hypothetical protein